MANEAPKLATLLKTLKDADDSDIPAQAAVRLLAKAVEALCQKLDADAGVTDTNYEATIEAVSL